MCVLVCLLFLIYLIYSLILFFRRVCDIVLIHNICSMISFYVTFKLHRQDNVEQFPVRASVEERDNKSVNSVSRIEEQEVDGSRLVAIQSSKVNSIKVNYEILAQIYASSPLFN